MSPPRTITSILSIVARALVIGVVSCAPITNQHGNPPDEEALSRIGPGVSRSEVADILGSPSSVATFGEQTGEETWYYIATRTETVAFYEPTVLDQRVVAIAFDEAGVVTSVRRYGLDDARNIEPVERSTATGGRKLTILQQLVGNLGRFPGAQTEP